MRGRRSGAGCVGSHCSTDAGDTHAALRRSVEGRVAESMLKDLGVCEKKVLMVTYKGALPSRRR